MKPIVLNKQNSEDFGLNLVNGLDPENRGRDFEYECLACGALCYSTIPSEIHVHRFELCDTCNQKHLIAFFKHGYGYDSVDLLCITKVLPVFYLEQLQPEEGFIDPMEVNGYFNEYQNDPASNYFNFCARIAKERNKDFLSKYSDSKTIVKL
jgi:hypothetical protein